MTVILRILSIFSLFFIINGEVYSKEKLAVGQLLFIGIQGTELSLQARKLLEEVQPGGIILFKRNIVSAQQTLQFNEDINQLFSDLSLNKPLLAIDQEGGGVYRVPTDPLLPSAAALGRTKNKTLIQQYGRAVGKMLRQLKFNMNLAPVLDLRIKDSDFIGSRSFGKNPKAVSTNGILFAKGLLEEGVLPTGKHFPGVGGLNLDPHKETPLGDLDWNKSWEKDLLPFRDFSLIYPGALLLSHVVYPKMDDKRKPASFSANIIENGLRKKIKFKGLVITDDLMMEGARKQASPSKSAIESLKAGTDMIMVTWSESLQKKLIKDIEAAIQNGVLDYNIMRQKIARITKVKDALKINSNEKEIKPEISFKSQELERLNTELLREILAMDNLNAPELKKNIAELPLYIVDSPSKMQKDIINHRSQKLTEFVNIKKTEDWSGLRRRMSKDRQSLVLFFIKNPKSIKNLNWFTDDEKKQIIVVNIQTANIKEKDKYAGVYSPFWAFNNFYSELSGVLGRLSK